MIRFKEIYEIWRRDNSLTRALRDSYEMLGKTRQMFEESRRYLRERRERHVAIDIYEEDRLINEYQREVRRKVLKYLAVTGGINAIPGLVLTSIVIDIERIGDYTKNISELAMAHPDDLRGGRYENDITAIEQTVSGIFEKTGGILERSDKKGARELLGESIWIRKRCDEIYIGLIKEPEPELSAGDAVTIALYVRFLKRVGAHLQNILSSVVNPFDRIGFHDKDVTLPPR